MKKWEMLVTIKSLYANSGRQGKLCKLVLCILLAALLLMMGGCSDENAVKEIQQEMTAYLNDRYGMEFEVESPYITGDGYAAHYLAKAHPKGHPEVQFIVNDSKSVKNPESPPPTPRHTDNYLKAKWSYQGKLEIEKKLREVYGPDVDFNIRRYEFGGANYAFKDLDFNQVFEKNHGHGGIDLDYDVFLDGTQFNKAAEAKKAYQIVKRFVLDFGGDLLRINVTYVDKAYKQDYLSNTKSYLDNWSVQHNEFHYSDQYEKEIADKKILNCLFWDPIVNQTYINSESDLAKCFRDIIKVRNTQNGN